MTLVIYMLNGSFRKHCYLYSSANPGHVRQGGYTGSMNNAALRFKHRKCMHTDVRLNGPYSNPSNPCNLAAKATCASVFTQAV